MSTSVNAQAASLPVQLFIGGQWQMAQGGKTFKRFSPLDPQLSTEASAAGVADAQAAANAAAAALPAWAATGPGQRRDILLKAAALLATRAHDVAAAMSLEIGASALWAQRNIGHAAGTLREAAALATQISGEIIPSDVPGLVSMGVRQPAGVVLGIAPWNAPIILAVRAIAVPLVCGNTVVLKGSETCPRTHALIAQVLQEAGLPPGVLNFIVNAPQDAADVVNALIAHPAVRRVNFTGSTKVGRLIARACAEHLKPAVLELGGKAPLLVLDDADLDAAVAAATFGAFNNSGQICMSTERLIVDESLADEFATKLTARAKALPLGDPREGNFVLGSVVDPSAVARCNALIDDALAKGAKLLCGGRSDNTLMQATVLDHVNNAMSIYHDESFGPVKGIIRVRSEDHAIAVANDTEFGLSASVFSRDFQRAWRVASRIDSGICHINGATVHDEAQMPFGGVKASGYGRFGGRAGIDAFTELRWITMPSAPRQYPF
jgi:benzaldehyde dehydrogenase (NAD)